jgi:hypothetical protein
MKKKQLIIDLVLIIEALVLVLGSLIIIPTLGDFFAVSLLYIPIIIFSVITIIILGIVFIKNLHKAKWVKIVRFIPILSTFTFTTFVILAFNAHFSFLGLISANVLLLNIALFVYSLLRDTEVPLVHDKNKLEELNSL